MLQLAKKNVDWRRSETYLSPNSGKYAFRIADNTDLPQDMRSFREVCECSPVTLRSSKHSNRLKIERIH